MTNSRLPANSVATNLPRIAVIVALFIYLTLAFRLTWHWPFVGDSQVLHYIVFLTHHGLVPYRDTYDMNMPGAYLCEGWALALFGASDLGWRLYDLSLALAIAAGMIFIARRRTSLNGWLAGFAAAVLFTLAHFADGPQATGQRDQVIAVLLVLSCTCLFAAVRHRRPWLMLPFALAATMSASIKPTLLPAGLVLLILASVQLRREAVSLRRYWLCAVIGSLLATGIVVAYLAKNHAATAFIHTLTSVAPHYGGWQRLSLTAMLTRSLPLPIAVFIFLGILAALLRKAPQTWEDIALLAFATIGALSYFVQGKGFPQHRYTLLAFLLLWACLQVTQALHTSSLATCTAIAAILCALLYVCPRELARTRLYPKHDAYTESLEADLTHLGIASLQHEVLCLDIIDGCLTTLYHLQIVQSTGTTGDLTVFLPVQTPAVVSDQKLVWSLISQHPPAVYILSNAQFGVSPRSFNGKLAAWPQFSSLLQSDYTLTQQRAFRDATPTPTILGQDSADVAYRIYLRRSETLR